MRTFNRIALAITAALFIACTGIRPDAKPVVSTAAQKPQRKADAQTQAEREHRLHELCNQLGGPFAKVDRTGLWVCPRWYALDFETKRQLAGLVFAFAFEAHPDEAMPTADDGRCLILLDNRTGKRVGQYDPHRGLRVE